MNIRVSSLALAILAVSMSAGGGLAQGPANQGNRAEAYAAIARLPAFEGVWQADRGAVTGLRAAEGKAPLTPKARAIVDAFQAAKARGEKSSA